MSRRDEAVEAGLREYVKRTDLSAFLEAVLAVLRPTVPNEVDALEALPVGTVLRGDAREEGVIVAHLTCLGWTEGEVPYDSTRLLFRHADLLGIDSWQVLWTPEDES